MQKLQLYIEGQRVDLFKDETVSLTQTLQNVKDIGKIFTEFTKTFAIPASRVNNKIFKHYYNFDIVGGFDARIKKDGKIELNTIPYKVGRIKLEGVELKNNVAHTYNITFKIMEKSLFKIKSIVIEGRKNGKRLGVPTANINIIDHINNLPEYGVYAGYINVKQKRYRCASY